MPFDIIWLSQLISVDFVDSNTRLGILKASFRLLSLLISVDFVDSNTRLGILKASFRLLSLLISAQRGT